MSAETLPKLLVGDLEAGRYLAKEMKAGGFAVNLWWSFTSPDMEPYLNIDQPPYRIVGTQAILDFAFPEK